MTQFSETDAGQDFIASAASRETSPKIMQAIAFFARDIGEAETLWNGDGFGLICTPLAMWEYVTENGALDAADFVWGAAGTNWMDSIESGFAGNINRVEVTASGRAVTHGVMFSTVADALSWLRDLDSGSARHDSAATAAVAREG